DEGGDRLGQCGAVGVDDGLHLAGQPDQRGQQRLDLGPLVGENPDGGPEVVDEGSQLGVALVEHGGDPVEGLGGAEHRAVDGGQGLAEVGDGVDGCPEAFAPAVEDLGAVGDQ